MTYRYVDAPRHAQLRDHDLGAPGCQVAVTGSGAYAVVADRSTPPELVGHALDYADRLAELDDRIPRQRDPEPRPAPLPAPSRRARRSVLGMAGVAALVLVLPGCTSKGQWSDQTAALQEIAAEVLDGPG